MAAALHEVYGEDLDAGSYEYMMGGARFSTVSRRIRTRF
jgi:hypothetical protein